MLNNKIIVTCKSILSEAAFHDRFGTVKPAAVACVTFEDAKLKPFSGVCSRHFVNGDSRCGALLVPALLTPVAIAEEVVLVAILPTLAPIVGHSTTVVAIEGGPDLTTVDGRSIVRVDSAP